MKEILELSFSLQNILPTLLLVVILLYWLTVFIGLLDTNSIDVDLDSHAHVDFDHDTDFDTDHDFHAEHDFDAHSHVHGPEGVAGGPNFMVRTLLFFHIGKIPFMILLSFIALPLWAMSLIFNNAIGNTTFIISILFLFPQLIISMLFAKIITIPLVKIFQKMDLETGVPEDFTGKTAIVKIQVDKDSDGQIELTRNNSTVVLIARSTGEVIPSGEQVIIIEKNTENNYFIVEPFKI